MFFRVRPDGSIPDTDYLISGYNQARLEIADRQHKIETHEVQLPAEPDSLNPYTWKRSKGSAAGRAREQFIAEQSRQAARYACCPYFPVEPCTLVQVPTASDGSVCDFWMNSCLPLPGMQSTMDRHCVAGSDVYPSGWFVPHMQVDTGSC